MQSQKLSIEEWNSTYNTIEKLAFKYSNRFAEVEDIIQSSMIRILNKQDGKAPTAGWMRTVVRSVAIDSYRTRRKDLSYVWLDQPDDLSVICERLVSKNTCFESDFGFYADLENSIDKLSKPMQNVLTLFAQGYTYLEIAQMTGQKIGTVRSRLHNARTKMQELLSDNSQLNNKRERQ